MVMTVNITAYILFSFFYMHLLAYVHYIS